MKYFSMFSGIGGFEYGISRVSNSGDNPITRQGFTEQNEERKLSSEGEDTTSTNSENCINDILPFPLVCCGYSEIDKYAEAIYKYHYGGQRGESKKSNGAENTRSQEDTQRDDAEGQGLVSTQGQEPSATQRRDSQQPDINAGSRTIDSNTEGENKDNLPQSATEKSRQTQPEIQQGGFGTSQEGGRDKLLPGCSQWNGNRNNGGHKNYGDATKINTSELPEFDLLVGGFPCQAFSIAGKRKGFDDTRGTLFFEIARICRDKRPRYILLENVKGLLSHDNGETFKTILGVLTDIGYDIQWQVLNSKNFGVPQNRERVFIVGYLGGEGRRQVFPIRESSGLHNSQNKGEQGEGQRVCSTIDSRYGALRNAGETYITKEPPTMVADFRNDEGLRIRKESLSPALYSRKHSDTDPTTMPHMIVKPVLTPDRPEQRQEGRRMKEDGEPMFTLTGQDQHGIFNGMQIRRLTPTECERLQGFPDGWTTYGIFGEEIKEISDSQRYKCLGNAVTTNVITEVIKRMF